MLAHVSDITQFGGELTVQTVVRSGIEYLLAAVYENFVIVPANRLVGSFAFPERTRDFRCVQNIPEAQYDRRSVTAPLQHLQRRKQFTPDSDGHVIHKQDLRVKNADRFLNRCDPQSFRFFQSDSKP